MRSVAADLEAAVRVQGRSKPLEKKRPWEVVRRTEPRVAWDLTWARRERKEEMKVGPIQCSLSPVRVRMKTPPRFSRVHMSFHANGLFNFFVV